MNNHTVSVYSMFHVYIISISLYIYIYIIIYIYIDSGWGNDFHLVFTYTLAHIHVGIVKGILFIKES